MPDTYIEEVIGSRANVAVYLINGFLMKGRIVHESDSYIVVLSDGKKKMVYKHAISTISPL